MILYISVTVKQNKRIFLDYASATPIDPRVLSAMRPYLGGEFANPSALYEEGVEAGKTIGNARKKVAGIIHALPDEIVFTGSGTESDNLAIIGAFRQAKQEGIRAPHIIISSFEHPAILEAASRCAEEGAIVTYIKPDEEGIIHPESVKKALTPSTILVSVMHAQNEIGTIEPIKEIAKVLREFKKAKSQKLKAGSYPLFHSDASQTANYIPLNVLELHTDLLTLDGSKIYGPKGVGMLFVKRGIRLVPQILGGGQERGLRSGTPNVGAIVGFARALEIAEKERESESKRVTELRDLAIKRIMKMYPNATLNGSLQRRLPNNINFCFPRQDSEFLVLKLDARGYAVSSSSSCRTLKENSRSYVIDEIGKRDCGESSIRITLGRYTTRGDMEGFLGALAHVLK